MTIITTITTKKCWIKMSKKSKRKTTRKTTVHKCVKTEDWKFSFQDVETIEIIVYFLKCKLMALLHVLITCGWTKEETKEYSQWHQSSPEKARLYIYMLVVMISYVPLIRGLTLQKYLLKNYEFQILQSRCSNLLWAL